MGGTKHSIRAFAVVAHGAQAAGRVIAVQKEVGVAGAQCRLSALHRPPVKRNRFFVSLHARQQARKVVDGR